MQETWYCFRAYRSEFGVGLGLMRAISICRCYISIGSCLCSLASCVLYTARIKGCRLPDQSTEGIRVLFKLRGIRAEMMMWSQQTV